MAPIEKRRGFLMRSGVAISTVLAGTSRNSSGALTVSEAGELIADHERRIRPLEIATNEAWWRANVSGKDEDFEAKEKSQIALDAALSDPSRFARLKAAREKGVADPTEARQVELLYLQSLEKQVPKALLAKITAKANAIEKAFNVYRAEVDGKDLSDSKLRDILKNSKDNEERKAVWEANKGVGSLIAVDLKDLVKLRNEAARSLGFSDFHVMMLALNEQDQKEVVALFDELDELTREPFMKLKSSIDKTLAERAGIAVDELRPWHYHDPFFQETPAIFDSDLDAPYAKADILKLCRDFYAGIGLPIDDVIPRSDLYEKPGKSPHAFCTDIDREGDVRVLANIVPNEYWMGTMLHELGHAVYSSKNIPRTLPYVVRGEAHILATEGVAMQFEQFSKDADWLLAMGVEVDDPEAYDKAGIQAKQAHLLIFSRWCQVMLRFEKAMYADPDQDLNTLWWKLAERYQGVRPPEHRNAPDFASKIHIVSAPAYYHNYMMGQLFASQVHHAICKKVLGGAAPRKANYVGDKRVGKFMIENVFGLGRMLPWKAMVQKATGEELNAKAFASDFATT